MTRLCTDRKGEGTWKVNAGEREGIPQNRQKLKV